MKSETNVLLLSLSELTLLPIVSSFPHVIVFRPSPAGSKLPVDPNPEVIDLNGVQPIDCVFDGTGRLWLSTLEGAPLSLMERAEDGWKAASDPALEAFNSEAIPLKPLEGKGATDLAVDFFPFGKVRKRIGEDDEEGEEGAGGEDQNQGGEGSKRGRKRGKR